jgi:hypothetical protein
MSSRFKIAIERSGLEQDESISFGKADDETTTNLVLKLWDLPEEFRERVKEVIRLCYYSGVQNTLTIVKSKKFSIEELSEECKKILDK